ncbi:MAG: hypothetical protein KBT10_08005 [Bacteroidales bacterium]|nr:hypothetical protein [Candidatus Sodaliphilus aphodohippi]
MANNVSKGLAYYMRVLHRNIGFLAIGMVIVYSLSGIVLIHRTDDFMKSSTAVEQTIKPGLTAEELGKELKLKKFTVTKEEIGVIYFSDEGKYEVETGKVSYVKKDYVFPFNKFAELHKSSKAPLCWFTTLFGIILFFLAISSLFMFKPQTKVFKKNLVYIAVGVIITLLMFLI